MSGSNSVRLEGIRKSYGEVPVLHGVDLDIEAGSFVVFVGPSGCGKSTLLRMIAGLESITSGTLSIAGEVVNDVPAAQRGIAMVFQSYALYPHMTVAENMSFSLRIAKVDRAEIDRRVRDAAIVLKLEPYLNRKPKQLSGGQRQRVAIGRAIVRNPRVFLFDEPLSNLDAALRVATRVEIAKLKEALPDTTIIYVTHDQVEAMTLADKIVVLSEGRIEQTGSPIDLYERPSNLFVARFIGSPAMNLLTGVVGRAGSTTRIVLADRSVMEVPIATAQDMAGKSLTLGIRPEDLKLSENGPIGGTVDLVESLGESTIVYVTIAGNAEPLIAKLQGNQAIGRGQTIRLDADAARFHLFGPRGQVIR